MKKFLSLVLALVMTMSLVTISAGATDFTDDSKVQYEEAVKVMDLLGIVGGYSDGTFRPTNTLTRGAAAKIITNFKLTPAVADALKGSETTFKDVKSSNVFSGYIAYCASEGIISGYGDGTFRPAGTLTGNAFMKMLLGALGYDTTEYTGNHFATKVALKVKELGLADGTTFVGQKAVTREEACLYAFNALQQKGVYYEGGSSVTINGTTIVTGAVEKEYKDTYGKRVFGLEKTFDYDEYGRAKIVWKYGKKTAAVRATTATVTYYGKVTGKTLFADLGLAKNETYDVSLNGADAVEMKGSAIRTLANPYGGTNTVVEVYYVAAAKEADNDEINIITVAYALGKVTGVAKATDTAERTITIKSFDGDKVGNAVAGTYVTESFEKGDVVLYAKKNTIQDVQLAKTIEGEVASTKGTSLTIGGVKYTAVKAGIAGAGDEGTFYLGVDNTIVAFTGVKAVASDNFAYIYETATVGGGRDDDGIQIGTQTKVYFVKADGTKGSAIVNAQSKTIEKDTVIAYTLNADGEISMAKPDAATSTTKGFVTTTIGKSHDKVEGFYMNATTKFVYVDIVNGKLVISVVDGYKNVENTTNAKVYIVGNGKDAKTVFVDGTVKAAQSAAKYGFLLDTEPTVTKGSDGNPLYTFSVMIDGDNKATLTTKDGNIFGNMKAGYRFSYTMTGDLLTDVKPAYAVKEGAIVEKAGVSYLGLKGEADTWQLADNCIVYSYDKASNTYSDGTVGENSIINIYTNGKTGADLRVTMIVITGTYEAED